MASPQSDWAKIYPWTKAPVICNGPMRLIALAPLATAVSAAGGIGFLGAGSDASTLSSMLSATRDEIAKCPNLAQYMETANILPVGVGFLLWAGEDLLQAALPILEEYQPAAVWLFAPSEPSQPKRWCDELRRVTRGRTQLWMQIGTVAAALAAVRDAKPDVLVIQAVDAGGHGLQYGSGLVSLVPEVHDRISEFCAENGQKMPLLVTAGGIMDSRGAAASLILGASGVCMGTRYLCSHEAEIAKGYQNAVLAASDGGVSTARSKLYDSLRGTSDWPKEYGGRGVLNASWHDAQSGMTFEENKKLYDQAMERGNEGWIGDKARLTTYAGSGVGLVNEVQGAGIITTEVRQGAKRLLKIT
ncbi:nitronate monooxygenase [Acrodontium crateriforme]|uniref:Nitronate monooxygenase n=1 Tax=Acrodontium crateriforme TaxID=150365 RepID=A0AAQ3MAI6_9PEZI|nr:nitronate monooxygenase [Acrodontium crateriforme]